MKDGTMYHRIQISSLCFLSKGLYCFSLSYETNAVRIISINDFNDSVDNKLNLWEFNVSGIPLMINFF